MSYNIFFTCFGLYNHNFISTPMPNQLVVSHVHMKAVPNLVDFKNYKQADKKA